MAALSDAPLIEVVELPQLNVTDLDSLLNEEIGVWQQRFAWDFRPSADLLRRFLQIHSLYGYALRAEREIIGYAYYVVEGRKGLIGDLYVRPRHSRPSDESTLLGALVQGMMLTPGLQRIESQLMLLRTPLPVPPFSRYLTRHDRFFMDIDRASALKLRPLPSNFHARFFPWAERYQEEIAHLVAAAYKGHVDSEINDQYRTIPGARHFLTNIIKFPGCGKFFASRLRCRAGRKDRAGLRSLPRESRFRAFRPRDAALRSARHSRSKAWIRIAASVALPFGRSGLHIHELDRHLL